MTQRLAIDRLRLTFANGAGQEHRVRPIVRRAMAMLHEAVRSGAIDANAARFGPIAVPPLHVDLTRSGDEAAARRITAAVVGALSARRGDDARPTATAVRPAGSAVPARAGETPCRR